MDPIKKMQKQLQRHVDEITDLLCVMSEETKGIQRAIAYGFLASELETWMERVKLVEGE